MQLKKQMSESESEEECTVGLKYKKLASLKSACRSTNRNNLVKDDVPNLVTLLEEDSSFADVYEDGIQMMWEVRALAAVRPTEPKRTDMRTYKTILMDTINGIPENVRSLLLGGIDLPSMKLKKPTFILEVDDSVDESSNEIACKLVRMSEEAEEPVQKSSPKKKKSVQKKSSSTTKRVTDKALKVARIAYTYGNINIKEKDEEKLQDQISKSTEDFLHNNIRFPPLEGDAYLSLGGDIPNYEAPSTAKDPVKNVDNNADINLLLQTALELIGNVRILTFQEFKQSSLQLTDKDILRCCASSAHNVISAKAAAFFANKQNELKNEMIDNVIDEDVKMHGIQAYYVFNSADTLIGFCWVKDYSNTVWESIADIKPTANPSQPVTAPFIKDASFDASTMLYYQVCHVSAEGKKQSWVGTCALMLYSLILDGYNKLWALVNIPITLPTNQSHQVDVQLFDDSGPRPVPNLTVATMFHELGGFQRMFDVFLLNSKRLPDIQPIPSIKMQNKPPFRFEYDQDAVEKIVKNKNLFWNGDMMLSTTGRYNKTDNNYDSVKEGLFDLINYENQLYKNGSYSGDILCYPGNVESRVDVGKCKFAYTVRQDETLMKNALRDNSMSISNRILHYSMIRTIPNVKDMLGLLSLLQQAKPIIQQKSVMKTGMKGGSSRDTLTEILATLDTIQVDSADMQQPHVIINKW